MNELFRIQDICIGLVVNRPSKTCKSPYVADVILIDHQDQEELNSEIIMVHSPSLGCKGLISQGEHVIMTKIKKPKPGGICKYTIIANAVNDGSIIMTHPLYCNRVWGSVLKNKFIKHYENLVNISQEVTVEESRFDFYGERPNGVKCYMEVKSVPLGSRDISEENSKYTCCAGLNDKETRISFFPDGYRKKKGDVVSPRALKHIQHLTRLSRDGDGNNECVMIYIIPREDTTGFILNPWDPIYKEAVEEGANQGVKIQTVTLKLIRQGYELGVYLKDFGWMV
jgi:DNA-binding sugar fermentation-stimulating protein